MQKKHLAIFGSLLILAVLVGAGCSNIGSEPVNPNKSVVEDQPATSNNQSENSSGNETSAPHETTNPGATVDAGVKAGTSLTAADVAKHNKKTDCYIIVRTSVYNVSGFIDMHPGGPDKILPLCGKDATAAFTGQHGGMEPQESTLASMKVAELKK